MTVKVTAMELVDAVLLTVKAVNGKSLNSELFLAVSAVLNIFIFIAIKVIEPIIGFHAVISMSFSARRRTNKPSPPCIPLMQPNLLRYRLMQHFTKVGGN